jgi:hypothetical protein
MYKKSESHNIIYYNILEYIRMSPNGLFVAVGLSDPAGNEIGTSTDGLNWTVATSSGSLFSGSSISGGGNGIAYGAGTFVAVGFSDPAGNEIGTSTDGLNWTVASGIGSLFSGKYGGGRGIAYGTGTFVAVGDSETDAYRIGTSTDGLNWTVATGIGNLFSGGGGGGLGIAYGLINGVGTFVAVGTSNPSGNKIGTSTDGLNWTVATGIGNLFSGAANGIAYGLVNNVGTFVVVGSTTTDTYQIGTSTDGLNWTVAAGIGSLFSGGLGFGIAYGLVNGVGTFVAVGSSNPSGNNIGTSTDGLNWTVATGIGNLFSGTFGDGGGGGYGIAYGLVNNVGTFVAVGISDPAGNKIGTSTDGLNWTVATGIGSLFSGSIGGGNAIAFAPPTPVLQSNICFPAGTPIRTDQGEVAIEKLQPGKHTLGRQAITHITQTITSDNYLIRIEKGAFGKNKPTKPTVMSKDHKIEYEGELVPAYRFLDYVEGIKKVKYSGEILYNVLLEGYGTMIVNNLRCETLEPTSPIACVYRGVVYKKEIVPQDNIFRKGWAKNTTF